MKNVSFHRQFLDETQKMASPEEGDSFVFEDPNYEWDYTESDILNQFGLLDLNDTGAEKTPLIPPPQKVLWERKSESLARKMKKKLSGKML